MNKKIGTSQYRGVYYNKRTNKWVVAIKKHPHHPSFTEEYNAGIYAEYFFRQMYNKRINFPNLGDKALNDEYNAMMSLRRKVSSEKRAAVVQGVKIKKNAVSKYVGIYKKNSACWCAVIVYRGKVIYLGLFSTNDPDCEEKAARAYDEKAKELYGEGAKLNFPE